MDPEVLLSHTDFVRGLAASLVYGAADVDDVVQETWLKALTHPPRPGPGIRSWLATVLLGVSTVGFGWLVSAEDPARSEEARIELEALRSDFAAARTRTRCGIHKRIYTLVEAYRQDHLFEGKFASLVTRGLPEERAQFFLDPWNSPYWVQHICSDDRRRRAIFVYSFGPDRRRDSTEWEILGDDVGAWISRPPRSASD